MPSIPSKFLLPTIIIACSVAIAFGLYLSRPEPKIVDTTPTPLLVDAIVAVKEDIPVSVRTQGTVTPRTATTLVAEVNGRVNQVSEHFKVGAYFSKGEILLTIDQRDYIAAAKRAEAAVASARSNLASEKGRAEVAYQDWLKYNRTVKRSDAATELALRKPQLDDAQAQLDSALADLEHAKDQLDRTVIRAPYDGLVKSKQVDIGQYVNVGATLAQTFAIDVAELRLSLPEHKLNYLDLPTLAQGENSPQPEVQLFATVGDHTYQWTANIVRTEGVLDERSRVLFAVAEITDPYGIHSDQATELRIGTFVEAHIAGRTMHDVIRLPRHLLRAGDRIWVIDDKLMLQNRQVTTLRTDGPDIYVTSGLAAGELVCVSSISGAVPGTEVRVAKKIPSDQTEPQPFPPKNGEPETGSESPAAESPVGESPMDRTAA